MPRSFSVVGAASFALLVVSMHTALANDGRDRYELTAPNELYHFYAPISEEAGLRVLPGDKPGGADGDPAFRWAQDYAVAVVEIAAHHVQRALGSGSYAMAIFDWSAENADTPIAFGALGAELGAKPLAPQGRHPGGSHDGGLNLDLGYYLTSLKGWVLEEDYAACSDHFEKEVGQAKGQKTDANRCLGPADRLDVDRQAFFYLELLKLHREVFAGNLLDEIGVDRAVFQAVRAKLLDWQRASRFGVTERLVEDFDALLTSDRHGGWQGFHHHHTHVRLQSLSGTGPMRDAIRRVLREARQIRYGLLARAHPDWPGVLDAQLASSRLERAIVVHVAAPPGAPAAIGAVRVRLNQGPWQLPDNPEEDNRYVFELETGVVPMDTGAKIEAEISLPRAAPRIIATDVFLPRQDARLHVTYRPGDVTGEAHAAAGQWVASVSYPEPLGALVTSVRYLFYPARGGGPIDYVVETGPRFLLRVPRPKGAPAIALVEAEVMLSGRFRAPVVLFVAGPEQPAL